MKRLSESQKSESEVVHCIWRKITTKKLVIFCSETSVTRNIIITFFHVNGEFLVVYLAFAVCICIYHYLCSVFAVTGLMAWCSGNTFDLISEVTVRWSRLVL